MITIFKFIILSLFPLFILAQSKIGCYSDLPSSYTDKSTYQYQTSSHCSQQCSGYSYFALKGGNTCICGNDAPSGSTTDTCNTPCYGYGTEDCGGSDSYLFYSTGNGGGSDGSSSSSSSASASAGGSNGGSSTTSSSTDTTTSSTKDSTTSSTDATTSSSNGGGGAGTTTSKTTTSHSETAVTTQSVSGTTVVIRSTVAASATSSPNASGSQSSSSSSSTASSSSSSSNSSNSSDKKSDKKNLVGPVVGGVVGGVAFIALLSLAFFFFVRHRSSNRRDAELADSAYFDAIKRDASTVSRPLSNPFLSKEDFTDQRLNPVMLGRRRISEGSLADEADYSRKILRVANPDDDL